MALSLGTSASAVTVAELQAQIQALMAQLAALQGGSTAPAATTFTQNLTVGSTGSEVTSLQQALVAKGFLTMPAGVAYGYFGPLTKSAVAAWQAANGVSPAAGYWGPISRAAYAASAGTTGGTTTTPGSTAGISTPGVEGSLTATVYPTPAAGTKVYEGDSKRAVMGIELEAKLSDVKVERIKVQVPSITYYREIASRMYVMDGSTVLASVDLNSDSVVKESSSYYVTITGFNLVVPKDSKKVLSLAIDSYSNIDSGYTDGDTFTLTIPANGVRGVDGAGINLYAPTAEFSRAHTPTADQADTATLAVSLNASTPDTQQVICESGTDQDECDELEVIRINFKAEDDDIKITDFVLDLARGGAESATGTVAYLYDGNTVVGSASVVSDLAAAATFSDIDWVVPADTTKTLSVRMDITDTGLTATTFTASTDAADVTAENSKGTTINASGSADGNTLTLRKVGPVVTLVSKSITTSGVPQTSSSPASTSTLTAKFTVNIKAVGGDLTLGTIASTTAPVIDSDGTSFTIYRNGTQDLTMSSAATSTSYTIGSACVTGSLSNGCTLPEGSDVTIEATYQILGRVTAGTAVTSGLYAVQFEGIQWFNSSTGSVQTTTFMSGDEDWRTTAVSFP